MDLLRRRAAAALLAAVLLPPAAAAGQAAREPLFSVDDPDLTALEALLPPTLEANHMRFAGGSGEVRGFGAGDRYPQVWLRDSATLVPLARYLYPRPELESWIREHLAHQRPEGSLLDWVAGGPVEAFAPWAPHASALSPPGAPPLSGDKNSVEADQESSAVLAALAVYRITGDRGWLEGEVAGQSLLWRCQQALQYLVRRRLDPITGLVTSGFAADWGDVSPVYPDQRAIYLDDATPRVLGLYTNALFHAAASSLRDVLSELGQTGRAAYWDHIAGRVAAGVEAELWQEQRGFYRLHRLLEPGSHPGWDDPARFGLGGNAVAVLYGLAGPERTGRILTEAERAQRRSGVSTVAGVLHPPYPRGFFRHPSLGVPYEYQNGGQWDWFAARLLLGAFENGHSERARNHLVTLARKARRSGGLYEWHTRGGDGRGSARYAGSAGALGAALLRGLFGVRLSAARLDLSVRLGDLPARVALHEPATATRVDYRYEVAAAALRLTVQSNHPRPGRLALRLPPGLRARAVRVDGSSTRFDSARLGDDVYAVVHGEWLGRGVEVELEEGG